MVGYNLQVFTPTTLSKMVACQSQTTGLPYLAVILERVEICYHKLYYRAVNFCFGRSPWFWNMTLMDKRSHEQTERKEGICHVTS